MAEGKRAGKPRRTWPQRLLIVFNVLCMTGALVTAGVLGYSNQKLSSVTRISLKNVLTSQADRTPGAPQNYLIVGADDGTGLDKGDPVNRGRQDLGGTFRTDTIMVLRIDPKDATARVLSIPRDLWVNIPGLKYPTRINSAVEGDGGASRLIETIKQVLGIPIDHYIQVNFAGFKKLVTTIGGVPIYFNTPVRAKFSTPFKIPEAGCHTLDGNEALDFVRIRKDFQYYKDGRWRLDDSGDYGRISRQQYFIQVALKRAFAQGIRNPSKLRELIDLGIQLVKTDEQLSPQDLLSIGNRFRNFNPENLRKFTIPATDAVHGGAQVLEISKKTAEPILEIFRGNATDAAGNPVPDASLAPKSVTVQLQNGGGIRNMARSVTGDLAKIGFATVSPHDAPGDFAATTLKYQPEKAAMARYVARFITGPVKLQVAGKGDDTTDVDVIVVIGKNWQGTETKPKADNAVPVPSSTTSTTSTTIAGPTTSSVPATTTTIIGFVPSTPPGISCG